MNCLGTFLTLTFCHLERTALSWQCKDSKTCLPLFWQAAAQSVRAHCTATQMQCWSPGSAKCISEAEPQGDFHSASVHSLLNPQLNQWNNSEPTLPTAAAFLCRLTKGNQNLDYLVFPAFGTHSWLIQNSLHCSFCSNYLNTNAAFYKNPLFFPSYFFQIIPQ